MGEPTLPAGFTSVQQIRQFTLEDIKKNNTFVNVIGFVTDWRGPKPTNGTDLKCMISLKDLSSQEEHAIDFTCFEPDRTKLPGTDDINVADIIIIRQAKVQSRDNTISLISTKRSTQFLVTSVAHLDSTTVVSSDLVWRRFSLISGHHVLVSPPNHLEVSYAVRANVVKRIEFPNRILQRSTVESGSTERNSKEKFRLLKDVRARDYADIIVQLRRVYDQAYNMLQIYVSDYTPNPKFYSYALPDDQSTESGVGDPYGYVQHNQPKKETWPGPYGKLSIVLALWDENAEFIRIATKADDTKSRINIGDWLLVKNVNIKERDGRLEGAVHGDGGKVRVSLFKPLEKGGSNLVGDLARYKDAVQRKKDYWKTFDEKTVKKRKNGGTDDQPQKMTNKMRRKLQRAAAQQIVVESANRLAMKLDLNDNVRCNHPDIRISSLKEILAPKELLLPLESRGPLAPFTNSKYRAHVRIIDFFPKRVEEFASGRRVTDEDILSDHSGGEDSDNGDLPLNYRVGRGFAETVWEWRFALQVEDASSKTATERMWLMVNNAAAQTLLGIEEDAADLENNPMLCQKLKEQLFRLWGDLEEKKSARSLKPRETKNLPASSPLHKGGTQPDIDSDSENSSPTHRGTTKSTAAILPEKDHNKTNTMGLSAVPPEGEGKVTPKNKAFTCCVQEYGVKVQENDPFRANAGKGQRWQRMFGLFGTQIR